MKFEHVLHIYWSNYFLFNTKSTPLTNSLPGVISNLPGLGKGFSNFLKYRFELIKLRSDHRQLLTYFPPSTSRAINVLLSKMTSIDSVISELQLLTILRLYLLKTYQGKSHMLGKPVRGQRTWSNAWTAYNLNKGLRTFINKFFFLLLKNKKQEKIDYKKIKKKQKKTPTKSKTLKKTTNIWF